MSLRRRMLQGAAVVSAGQALGQGLSFVRNIIVARLISPEDFGIAATFALTVSLLEMLSDVAPDKLLIQAPDGDDARLQATAQCWQFVRGLGSALLIAALAWPVSRLFGVPQAQWAFYWLALVPLLRGLVHLDIKRLQRSMRFVPQLWTDVGSQALITVAAWPLAHWTRSYTAVLWLVLAQSAALALLSHLLAERPYRWNADGRLMRRLLDFGWPLLVNGLLMFGIVQGDRLIVGTAYSIRDLGVYSAAVALATAPAALLNAVVSSVMLPVLAGVQFDRPRFQQRYVLCAELFALLAGLLAVLYVCTGARLLVSLFGPGYAAGGALVVVLGVAQSIRLVRVGPTVAALALGDTRNCMWANVGRLGGVAGAVGLALHRAALGWIPVAALAGELLALVCSLARLARRYALAQRACLQPSGCAALFVAAPALAVACGWFPRGWPGALLLTFACGAGCALLVACTSAALGVECRAAWSGLRQKSAPLAAAD